MEFSETYYYHVSNSAADFTKSDFAASYTGLSENYDLGLGFAYLSPSNTEDEENRPYVLATIKGKLLNVEASNRSIIEYRMQAGLHDSWRFRDKIQITDPLEAFNSRHKNRKEKRIVPFIFDEMFVSSNGEGFDQNRASAGVQIKLTKNAVTGVYYMLLTEKDAGRWSNSNVIGIDLIYEF
ncbi:MAG: hypothetical protein A2Y07_10280 [Planctomycetes bacterium GWF2_50_10]|nr:MAG: hypothetical protein A2Y07_10280 [Planctomycetes bacterium GWF2_50_10]